MKTEFVHWGIPKGKKDEEILYTKSRTLEGAEKIKSGSIEFIKSLTYLSF